jgi:hypothetical protein
VRSEEWVPLAQAHAERARQWTQPHLERRRRGIKHPIEDFLFDYYPYSPSKLERWHPGYGVVLEGPESHPYLALSGYRPEADGATADVARLGKQAARLATTIAILEATADRSPVTGCFALHEWAMVYGCTQEQVRHSGLPLRMDPGSVVATVDELGLRCTHLDAFRFFAPEAVPLNSLTPTRVDQVRNEQPGCLHASMDLYKYGFWFSPFVPSELVLDCFENAMRARELDMRASPYDMEPFGLEPIRVETPEGRHEYASEQRALMTATAPLRTRLLGCLLDLQDHARP